MNNVKQALTRKIGPLPAWVYAIIFGLAVYWYRNRQAAKAQTVLNPATQPGIMDSQVPQDIVPLSPGQSAYNPNTGQLVGTAPEQFPPQPPADRPLPITLEPGESLYDPATGQLIHGDIPAAAPAKAAGAKPKPKKVKRKPKKKPHHVAKHKPAKHTEVAHKGKGRSHAHLQHPRATKPHTTKPAPKHRTRAPAPPAHRPAPRHPTVHYAQAKPAVRQHAAPTRRAPTRPARRRR